MVHFFNKKLVYKQLALWWQITKQLSELNLLSLSNIQNYKLNWSEVKIAVKPNFTKIQLKYRF